MAIAECIAAGDGLVTDLYDVYEHDETIYSWVDDIVYENEE